MGSCNLSPFVENEGVSLALVSRVSPLSSEGCSAAMPVKKESREEKNLFGGRCENSITFPSCFKSWGKE